MTWSIPGSHVTFSKRAASSWLLFWFRAFEFGLVASVMSGCKQDDPVGQDSHVELSAIGATPRQGKHGVVDQDFPSVKNGRSAIFNGTKFLNPYAVVCDNHGCCGHDRGWKVIQAQPLGSGRVLFFVHVPKSAGSSFEVDAWDVIPSDWRFGSGHFCLQKYIDFSRENGISANYSVFLREPSAIVRSVFHHCRDSPCSGHRLSGNLSSWLSKQIRGNHDGCFDPSNLMVKMIAGQCDSGFEKVDVTDELFEMAKHRLRTMFFFGIAEFYAESLCLLHFKLGQRPPEICNCEKNKFLNSTIGSHQDHGVPDYTDVVGPSDHSMISNLTKWDKLLYDFSVILFRRQVATAEQQIGFKILCN